MSMLYSKCNDIECKAYRNLEYDYKWGMSCTKTYELCK